MTRRCLALCCGGWLVASALQACGEYGARIYSAHPYRAGRPCLEPSLAIGVVQAGELAATCPGRCLLLDETLYVSSVCPPAPVRARSVEADASPACADALALLDSQSWCEPAESPDESGDAGAPSDAAALP
jgi:hypothetical protein